MGLGESRHSSDDAASAADSPEDVLSSAANIVAQERALEAAFPNQRIRSARPGHSQIASILRELVENRVIDIASNADDLREALHYPRSAQSSEEGQSEGHPEGPMSSGMHRYHERERRPTRFRYVTGDEELRKSYDHFMHDLETRNGAIHFLEDHFSTTHRGFLPDMILRRELNLGKPFSLGQRATVVNSYIPNTRKVVGSVKSKTFVSQFVDRGNSIITASQDGHIRLYRRGAGDRYRQLYQARVPVVSWAILDFVISSDSRHFIYSTWDTSLYQCTLNPELGFTSSPDWMSLPLIENDRFAAFSLKFSADDSEVIAGGNEHSIFIFNRELNKTVLRLNGHDDDVWDRRILADATHTPEPVGVFAGHRDGLTFIDPRGDDRYILTNSKDQTIKLWDLRHFSSIEGQKATKQAVSRQGWDYRWQSPEIVRSPLPGDASIMTFRGSHSVLHTLLRARFSPDHTGKRFIYASCAKGNVVVYDMFSGEVCTILEGHKSVVRDCHWHPQYNEIISSSWDGQTALWKFDERAVREPNPDSDVENIGCEDSSDEFYRPISKDDKRPKRKPRPRFNPYNLDRPDLIDEQYDDEDKPRTTRSMTVQQPTRAATTSRVTAPKRRELMGRYAQALQRRKRGRVGSPSPETSRRT
ncbi:hypothetical protein QR680_010932 [Steinernema hermaphroditum]|uniref:DDB1- and CUL4-associated factor 11 n=1 Tax=Steinernema hermaphroditum TaxID=289476 RepID=A0AA39IS16_9BILA|nr:hypothetical protein QR680_010932 [Steinernema hermaphroditum]